MPTIMIYQSPRPLDAKQRAIAEITKAVVNAYGLKPDQVQVYFHEASEENWGRGGALGSGPPGRPS